MTLDKPTSAEDLFRLNSRMASDNIKNNLFNGSHTQPIETALALLLEAESEISQILEDFDPVLRERIYTYFIQYTLASEEISRILFIHPSEKTIDYLRMTRVRPQRAPFEEAAITEAVAHWIGSNLSRYKQSIVTSAELKADGINISPKALRDRFKKMSPA